jgi:uncharacterized protein YbgA (DUF1722 family)/uncharacterized protein YbbK (DUF523 family)
MDENLKPVGLISKCLEHAPCRWNGLLINSPIVRSLKAHVQFIAVCPELEIGLGAPRRPLHIVKKNNEHRLVQSETEKDLTEAMIRFTDAFLSKLPPIDGIILKERSPSCGLKNVKVFPSGWKAAPVSTTGHGFFGRAVAERFPYKALETVSRLNNFRLREHFLTTLFTMSGFRKLSHTTDIKKLIEFHTTHKYLLMAYDQKQLKIMGAIAANHKKKPLKQMLVEYQEELFKTFSSLPSFKNHINVLLHAFAYFSHQLSTREKALFLDTLESYRSNKLPLSACTTLLSSWIVRFHNLYLRSQTYFAPYPRDFVEMTDSGKGRDR